MKQAPTPTRAGSGALGCSVEPRATGFRRVLRLLLATLREIFDESAYQRFLTRQQLPSGRSAYAAFLREQEIRKARQPKCC